MSFEPIDQYLETVRRVHVPEAAELDRLRSLAQDGDQGAQIEFTRAHLAQAAGIALRLRPGHITQSDAINEANTVLVRLIYDTTVENVAAALETRVQQHYDDL
jgi:hypothetical protein